MLVREVMNSRIETIRPEAPVAEAARKMRDGDFGVLPVKDGDNFVGMVTDRDLAIRVLAEGSDPGEITIEDVMTPDTLCVHEEDSIEMASELMADRQVRRLAVMDRNEKLVGILSVGDLAVMDQDKAGNAISGISEPRHDEPGKELNH